MGLDQYLEGQIGCAYDWRAQHEELGYWRKATDLDMFICSNFDDVGDPEDWNSNSLIRLTTADLEKIIDTVLDEPALAFPLCTDGSTRWQRVATLAAFTAAARWLDEGLGTERSVFYRNCG